MQRGITFVAILSNNSMWSIIYVRFAKYFKIRWWYLYGIDLSIIIFNACLFRKHKIFLTYCVSIYSFANHRMIILCDRVFHCTQTYPTTNSLRTVILVIFDLWNDFCNSNTVRLMTTLSHYVCELLWLILFWVRILCLKFIPCILTHNVISVHDAL